MTESAPTPEVLVEQADGVVTVAPEHHNRPTAEYRPVAPVQPCMQIGHRIDDVSLIDHDGRPWSLAEQRGRTVLLVFHRHLM